MNIECKLAMSGGFTGTISQALPPEVLFPILYFNGPCQCLRVGRLLPITRISSVLDFLTRCPKTSRD